MKNINIIKFYSMVYIHIYMTFTKGEIDSRHSWATALIVGVQSLYGIDLYYFMLKFTDYGSNEIFVSNSKLIIYIIIITVFAVNSYLINQAKKNVTQICDNSQSKFLSYIIPILMMFPMATFIAIFYVE